MRAALGTTASERWPLEIHLARHAELSTAARDDVLDLGSSSRASVDNSAAVIHSAVGEAGDDRSGGVNKVLSMWR